MRRITRAIRGDGGQALIEFAFVAPLLLVLLFAVFDIASALNYWNDETNLANVVARYTTVIGSSNTAPPCSVGGTSYLSGADPNFYGYVKCEAGADSNTLAGAVGVCVTDETYTAAGDTGTEWSQNDAVKITVMYPYNFLNFLSGVVGKTHVTLTSSATMMLEDPMTGSSLVNAATDDSSETTEAYLANTDSDTNNPAVNGATASEYNGGCANVS